MLSRVILEKCFNGVVHTGELTIDLPVYYLYDLIIPIVIFTEMQQNVADTL